MSVLRSGLDHEAEAPTMKSDSGFWGNSGQVIGTKSQPVNRQLQQRPALQDNVSAQRAGWEVWRGRGWLLS